MRSTAKSRCPTKLSRFRDSDGGQVFGRHQLMSQAADPAMSLAKRSGAMYNAIFGF